MKEVAVGMDIGGTNTKIGIVDEKGDCLIQNSIETSIYARVDDYLSAIKTEIDFLLQKAGENLNLQGIGIGAPNANYYNGTIEHAPNLPWKGIINFIEKLKQFYNVPMAITNDANAAAIGEMIYGGAQNMNNFIVVTLGTGLGSGFVVNGHLLYGADGFAGELGHVTVDYNGRQCGCGRLGCLETYVSATGIKRTVFQLLAERVEPSKLRNITFDNLTAEMITKEALKGDTIALEAFEITGRILGEKLADTIALMSPEAIFLFGGLANAKEFILDPTLTHMEKNLMPIFKNKVKLLPSMLKYKNAAVLGASALVWNEIRTNRLFINK
ncbi:MAG: ROK family protein [Bacteroidota bacterium]|nr:ROK family protein [Bacteroidota bacterium]